MKASKVLNKDILYNHKVNKLSINSKNIEENDIFFAIKGSKEDGNNYIEEAVRNGAKTVVTENTSTNIKVNNINVIIVKDINKYLAECAKIYYKDISKKIKLIGVTGTNGKTSTATLVYKVSAGCFSESLGYNCCKGCDIISTDESGNYNIG